MDELNGVLLVDKPEGPTSHDVVDRVRRRFGFSKVGHAGTLDPIACGLLILLIGRSTKNSNHFLGQDKVYEGTLTLGVETDTGDRSGKILCQIPVPLIPTARLKEIFQQFEGERQQLPPMYSAVKVQGRKLYQLARKGLSVERQARRIRIQKLELKKIRFPEIDFLLHCSKGTYVRSLVEEIGKALGTPAMLSHLRRLQSGPFRIEESVSLQKLLTFHRDELNAYLRNDDARLLRSCPVT